MATDLKILMANYKTTIVNNEVKPNPPPLLRLNPFLNLQKTALLPTNLKGTTKVYIGIIRSS